MTTTDDTGRVGDPHSPLPRRTQEQRVLGELNLMGERGVCSAWGYKPHVRIPRLAAVVWRLRRRGYRIESRPCTHSHPEAGTGRMVTYVWV